jgi:uncharacterized Zn-binding protein involved in type VI secretion
VRGVARVGDRTFGTCFSHPVPIPIGGTIVSGAPTVIAEGLGVARLGDTVITDCGHNGTIITGSPTVISAGAGSARLGDSVVGAYVATIISAAALTTTP